MYCVMTTQNHDPYSYQMKQKNKRKFLILYLGKVSNVRLEIPQTD